MATDPLDALRAAGYTAEVSIEGEGETETVYVVTGGTQASDPADPTVTGDYFRTYVPESKLGEFLDSMAAQ